MTKHVLSVLVACALVVATAPTPGFAAPNDGNGPNGTLASDCADIGGHIEEGECRCGRSLGCYGSMLGLGVAVIGCLGGFLLSCGAAAGGVLTVGDACPNECDDKVDEVNQKHGKG